MPKERINVTVDESVKRELSIRDDLNVSGMVNDFLGRRLEGESENLAALRTQAERKKTRLTELKNEVKSLKRQIERIEDKIEEKQREEQKELEEVLAEIEVGPTELESVDGISVKTKQDRLEYLAEGIGYGANELKEMARKRYENETNDPTYQ